MSDHSISIVPRQSVYPNNKAKGKEILDWLTSRDIVKSTLSDCILSSEKGYAISEGAKNVTILPEELPFDLLANGLEIVTKRQIFDTTQNGMDECICPNCKKDIALEDWSFFNEWYEEKSNNLTCPLCNIGTEIHKYKFIPEWGFSNLGFTFWNWPDLTSDFLKEFSDKLACEISVVYSHI